MKYVLLFDSTKELQNGTADEWTFHNQFPSQKSGLVRSKAEQTSWRHNAMQWELPPWTRQQGQFMKMSWGMTHPIWSSICSMKWTKQWTLIDLHVKVYEIFFWGKYVNYPINQMHPWLSSLPAPTKQPRLTPQQVGSPTSRPREYRLTWNSQKSKWNAEPGYKLLCFFLVWTKRLKKNQSKFSLKYRYFYMHIQCAGKNPKSGCQLRWAHQNHPGPKEHHFFAQARMLCFIRYHSGKLHWRGFASESQLHWRKNIMVWFLVDNYFVPPRKVTEKDSNSSINPPYLALPNIQPGPCCTAWNGTAQLFRPRITMSYPSRSAGPGPRSRTESCLVWQRALRLFGLRCSKGLSLDMRSLGP